MRRLHAITPTDSIDPARWRETNPDYVTGDATRKLIPHRETGALVACCEVDGGKAWEMAQLGRSGAPPRR